MPFVIFHATDLHPDGGVAFEHSVALARDMGAELHTVHAVPPNDEELRPLPHPSDLLGRWSCPTEVAFTSTHHRCCDDPVETLLDAMSRTKPDLAVVGTHQKGRLERLFDHAVSGALAATSKIPTLFLPIGEPGFVADSGAITFRRVLIPVGNHTDFTAAVTVIVDLCDRLGRAEVDFHLLHVGPNDPLDTEFAPEHPGWRWIWSHAEGALAHEVEAYCEKFDIDLIVMATRGRDGLLDAIRGTNAQQTLRAATCPVLVIPHA